MIENPDKNLKKKFKLPHTFNKTISSSINFANCKNAHSSLEKCV